MHKHGRDEAKKATLQTRGESPMARNGEVMSIRPEEVISIAVQHQPIQLIEVLV